MIETTTAFASGAIFSAALVTGIFRRKDYTTFRTWWNAEGCCVWLLASVIGGALLIPR